MPPMTAAKPSQLASSAVCTLQGSILSLAILTLISFTCFSLKSLHFPLQYSSYHSNHLIITNDSVASSNVYNSIVTNDSEEFSDIYHSPEIFKLNYAEMEKKFKVYTYTDGDPNTYYQTPRKLTGKYASEGYFFQNIRESKFRTDDPDEADLFFIPISCHKMRGLVLRYAFYLPFTLCY